MPPSDTDVPTHMSAFRLTEWGQPPRTVEVPVPEPAAGEVLVRVAGNGLCHSDITMMEIPAEIGEMLGWSMPFTLGHEVSGWIVATGPDTALPDGLTLGDTVAILSAHSCGVCEFCVEGRDSLCVDGLAGRGDGRDGGLAEFVVARADRDLIPLGDLDPVTAGTLTDAAATSYHAVERVLSRLGEHPHPKVLVIGIGGLGSYVVQLLAALSDATIIAVDAEPAHLERARQLGAHHAVSGIDSTTRSSLREIVADHGCHAVIDVVGTDETIAAGIAALRPGGVFALVGSAGGGFGGPWFSSLPREAEFFTFQGSRIAHVRAVVELARQGRIVVDAERFSFDDVATAYERLHQGTLTARAVVSMVHTPGDAPH